jgi:hypothetical protein
MAYFEKRTSKFGGDSPSTAQSFATAAASDQEGGRGLRGVGARHAKSRTPLHRERHEADVLTRPGWTLDRRAPCVRRQCNERK